ncbi:MAG: hypothetical protein ABI664_12940 [bacterium]
MTIDANVLRLLAEAAEGLRNQDLVLVTRADVPILVAAGDVLGTDTVLTAVRTDDAVTRSQRPAFELELQIDDGPNVPLSSDYDSSFWSLSAVDKFMIPYYARIWSPGTMLAFRSKIATDSTWIAIGHPPGSGVSVLCYTVSDGFRSLTVAEYLA